MSFTNMEDYFIEDFDLDEEDVVLQPDADTPDKKYLDILSNRFGHRSFRPMQWKIINSIITEKRDVCAIMATGYGKSLCYQFPSVYNGGITIVISPLISLMEDQVLSLKMNSVPSCLLGSAQNKQSTVINDIITGQYTIVYATPEFCLGDLGMSVLQNISQSIQIDLLAIDEAHCVSQWGHDFRVQYRNLWKLRAVLKNVPVLAVTATATPKVQTDICSSLKLKNPVMLMSSFDRPNLYFEVKMKSSRDPFDDLKYCMGQSNTFPGSTIIYCLTKKITDDVCQNLQAHGIKAVRYHAGISINQRKEAHEKFVKDKVKVVVATIAFGMGIDKPDVRTVIHYGASKDIEGYYQEVGRAGRDGLPAKCVCFFSAADFILHQHLREAGGSSRDFKLHLEENSHIMQKYLDTQDCRRRFILNYFDEQTDSTVAKNNCCDNCTRKIRNPNSNEKLEGINNQGLFNIAEDAKLLLLAVNALGGKFGLVMYILLLRGSKSSKLYKQYQKLDLYGKGKHQTEEWWKIIGRLLTTEGYLQNNYQRKTGKMSYVTISVSEKGKKFLSEMGRDPKTELLIAPPQDMKKFMKLKTMQVPDDESWRGMASKPDKTTPTFTKASNLEDPIETAYRIDLYKILTNCRTEIAHNVDCMPYMVASNTALMQLARLRPTTIEEFKSHAIDGFNVGKIQKFGDQLLECINNFKSTHSDPTRTTVKPTTTTTRASQPTSSGLSLCIPNSSSSQTTDPSEKWLSNAKVDKNEPKNGVTVLKRFAFVERKNKMASSQNNSEETDPDETQMETEDVTPEKKAFTFKNQTNQPAEEPNDSFGWLDSPEHQSDDLIGPTCSQSKHDDSLMLDDDGFDTDLMNIVDNIEEKVEVKPAPPAKMENKWIEPRNKIENTSESPKRKANQSFSDWMKMKKSRKDN